MHSTSEGVCSARGAAEPARNFISAAVAGTAGLHGAGYEAMLRRLHGASRIKIQMSVVMSYIARAIMALIFVMAFAATSNRVYADADLSSNGANNHGDDNMIETMREMHQRHQHGHDFEAMREMEPEQMVRIINLMRDIGLVLPAMDAARGRQLFVNKGCVMCHSVNGVGTEIGPSLNAADMPFPMNILEFAARMWRGASTMTAMQEERLGGVISLTGQELADLIAFAHDAAEQERLTESQIPERFRDESAE